MASLSEISLRPCSSQRRSSPARASQPRRAAGEIRRAHQCGHATRRQRAVRKGHEAERRRDEVDVGEPHAVGEVVRPRRRFAPRPLQRRAKDVFGESADLGAPLREVRHDDRDDGVRLRKRRRTRPHERVRDLVALRCVSAVPDTPGVRRQRRGSVDSHARRGERGDQPRLLWRERGESGQRDRRAVPHADLWRDRRQPIREPGTVMRMRIVQRRVVALCPRREGRRIVVRGRGRVCPTAPALPARAPFVREHPGLGRDARGARGIDELPGLRGDDSAPQEIRLRSREQAPRGVDGVGFDRVLPERREPRIPWKHARRRPRRFSRLALCGVESGHQCAGETVVRRHDGRARRKRGQQ